MPASNQPGQDGAHREHRQSRQQAVCHDQAAPAGVRTAIIIGHSPTLCRAPARPGGNHDHGQPSPRSGSRRERSARFPGWARDRARGNPARAGGFTTTPRRRSNRGTGLAESRVRGSLPYSGVPPSPLRRTFKSVTGSLVAAPDKAAWRPALGRRGPAASARLRRPPSEPGRSPARPTEAAD
jgi:hypothetical protein